VGGRDNFFHCDTCGACYAIELRNNHVCVPNSMQRDCPICYEVPPPLARRSALRREPLRMPASHSLLRLSGWTQYLFDSLEAPQVLRCGHTIHRKCLESYSAHGGYTCPLCNASVCDMRAAWLYLDEEIRHTPMPEEYAGQRVSMLCNDCHERGQADFHALGLKCSACGSYNTRRV
jgi:RING finger/CHY zinc finger protein 1